MAVNRLFLVLGLLASAGSLVQARFYRGGGGDYTADAHASTEVYASREYTEDSYDYNQNTKRTDASSLDWAGSDYPRSMDRTNPSSLDWAGHDNTRSMDRTDPSSLDWAGYDYTRSMDRTDPGSLDWDMEERSEFNGGKKDESWVMGDYKSDPKPAPKGNPIDDCWRRDSNWPKNRQALANCAVGFGKNAMGGADGTIYVVTDDSDDELVNPKEGTLRYGVLQDGPLWITFARGMNIKLKNELIMSSHKTIDGRGFNVHITGGAGLTLQYTSNIIIHGLFIHDLKPTGAAVIRSNSSHSGHRMGSDGDAINIYGSHDIWVDHCYFARGPDGLVDVVMGSTAVSITNNFFEQHDKVMLFGAHPYDDMDNDMQVSVAYNHFGRGLIERTPRVRHGHAHIFNNYYATWGQYAIGGSESPTILSEGNVFNAPDTHDKQVTKRIDDGDKSFKDAKSWNWQSVGDKFLNGAYFVASGVRSNNMILSKAASTNRIVPADIVPDITSGAGPLVL